MRYSGSEQIEASVVSLRSIDELSKKLNFRHMGLQVVRHHSGAALYMRHERGPKHTACVVDLEFDSFGDLFGYQALICSGNYVICSATIGICNIPESSEMAYFAKLHYMGGLPTFGVRLMVKIGRAHV